MRHLLDKITFKSIKQLCLQLVLLFLLSWVLTRIAHNVQVNLQARGVNLGFEFLKDTSGFGIIFHLIPYSTASHYFQVFWVGVLNTLLVASVAIIFATLFGFIVGIARVSSNKLIAFLGTSFVEVIRNIPLLLQLFFWYFVVLRSAPYPQESIIIGHSIILNNRGLYLPLPMPSAFSYIMLVVFIITIALLGYISSVNRQSKIAIKLGLGLFAIASLWLVFNQMAWEKPLLGKFNYEGGLNLIPEFIALVFALSVYTAAFIAENVRMGIQSVAKGQTEAARSLGLSRLQTLRWVLFPQALKVILPPLTNQYLNITKNSSLATAIAFPDLVSVFAGTVLNQTGHAIEIIAMTMGVYLFISLMLSFVMQIYERRSAWKSS